MGGGHYVTTVRHGRKPNIQVPSSSSSANSLPSASSPETPGGKWFVFNDGLVSPIQASQICEPSAYVLFYRRKDCANMHHLQLFPQGTEVRVRKDPLPNYTGRAVAGGSIMGKVKAGLNTLKGSGGKKKGKNSNGHDDGDEDGAQGRGCVVV